jgi:PAS domain S-box-containing protein
MAAKKHHRRPVAPDSVAPPQAEADALREIDPELKTTRDDLQRAVQELQSANEELTTVNGQLHEKIRELEGANNDLANLLNCTDVATVFVDLGLRVKRFTPAARRLFRLIPADAGRPLGDVATSFTDEHLLADAAQVLRDLAPREAEVRTWDGRWWARRRLPYRTLDNRMDGVVLTFVDITERKKAEETAVRRLATLVESSADAIFCKDLDGTIRSWNSGAELLFGYASHEIVGRSVGILVPDDRAEEWTAVMAQLARGQHNTGLETERLRKDGQRVSVAVTISPMVDDDGTVVGASIIARDITGRKRAEEERRRLTAELRGRVEELTTLLDVLPCAVLMADPLCRRMTGNRAFYQMVGLPEGGNVSFTAEAPDLPAGLCVHRGGRQLAPDKLPMHLTGQSGQRFRDFDHELVFADGRVLSLVANTAPLLDEQGGVRGVVGAYTDITERKRAETALRDREARLAAILEAAADAIITIDAGGAIQTVNVAAERMFGYAAAELLGQRIGLLMPSPHREAHNGYLARYALTGEKHVIGIGREVEARRKDGEMIPVELAVSEIPSLKLFTGILRDITVRRRLEREVVEIASLQQRRIGADLHDSVAQELTALNLLARDLAEILQTDPGQAPPLVARIRQGLQRSQRELRTTLRGLLPVAVEGEGLMVALTDLAERTQREAKVVCAFDCPRPVSVADNLTATHLYLIAQEAVHNAVKHGRPRTIRIGLRSNEQLVLQVQNDGRSIPARMPKGGGVGLRIMKNRAAIIGATLSIEPAEPTGTLVTCVLARREREQEKEPTAGPGADRG